MFINDLPNSKDTRCFSTDDASGSTSQAAGIIEGMESGSSVFLLDEDTSATNFMVRDAFMQRLIAPDKEPITPFLERARDLYAQAGISTVLVAGSSGAFSTLQIPSYRWTAMCLWILQKKQKSCVMNFQFPRHRSARLQCQKATAS